MLKKEILDRINEPFKKEKIKVYLAGPMEFLPDHGTGWRSAVETVLVNDDFSVFNPANEVKIFKEMKKSKELRNNIKGLRTQFSRIIRVDLKEVITSDVIICNWTPGVFSAGTSGELTVAKLFNIPILMVCEDISKLPKWILGCITSHQKDFKNLSKNIKKLIKSRGTL